MNQDRIRVLLLDDDDHYRRSMAAALRVPFGFQVDEAADGPAALQQVIDSGGECDVVLIDQHLEGDEDGIAVLSEIRQAYAEIECIILTGYAPEDRERAIAAGAFRYIEKLYVNHNELALLIRAAAQQARMRALSRDILSRLERKDALRRILDAAASLLEVDDAALALYSDEAGRWEWFCLHPEAEGDNCAPLHRDALADEIRRSQRPVSVAGLQEDPRHQALAARGLASMAGVPIPGKSAPLGALFAYSRRPDHFDVDRLGRLQSLATQAGLALDNAETYQRTSNLAVYMGALSATNFKLAQTTDLDELLRLAWEFVHAELQVATFYVALYDPETDEVTFPVLWDDGVAIDQPPFVLTGDDSLTAHVIRSGDEYYWPTPEDKDGYCESVNIIARRKGRGCKSCLFFPLRIGGRVIGAMSVQAYEPHAFPVEYRIACRALSNQLAAALENARLMSEVRHRAVDLATLQELSVGIASSLEMKRVGEQTCAAAVQFFRADHSGLVLFGDGDKTGRVAAEYPPAGAVDRVIPLDDVEDERTLMRDRLPLIIENVAERESLGPVRDTLFELGVQATLIVPVVAAGRLLGSFSIDYYQPHRFSQQDVDNAGMFAAQVAVALDHARYYEDAVRSGSQVRLLHKISDRIQAADDLEDIFHMVLTGVTADFGLRFNAAALLLFEGDDLVGQIGVGHFNRKDAEADWLQDEALGQNDFDQYYERLRAGEFRANRTPLDRAVRALRIVGADRRLLGNVVDGRALKEVHRKDHRRLPRAFIDAFRPGFPLLVAPLLSRQRVIGLLVADNRFTTTPVTEDLKDLFQGFADAAAVAIDNAWLQRERQRQLQESHRLRRIAEAQAETNQRLMVQRERVWSKAMAVAAVVAQEELEATLNAIAESSRTALEADVVTVYSYDAQTQRFTDLGYSIIDQRAIGSIRLPRELPMNSVLYDIIAIDVGPRLRLHDETRPDPALVRGEFVKSEGIQASVGLQLRGRDGRSGVMFVNYRSAHRFDDAELDFIQLFANQAAAAIYGQQQFRNATHRARVLEALNKAAQSISSASTLEATLEQIAVQALAVVEATDTQAACHVALRRGESLQFAAAWPPEILNRLREKVGVLRLDGGRAGIVGRVVRSGESVNLANALEAPDYLEFEPGTRSELAVPIKQGDDVIGVINLEHPEPAYFKKEDQGVLENLAALATAAIQNAQHLEQKQIVADISAKVNASRELGQFLNSLFEQLVGVFGKRETVIHPSLGLYEPETEQLRMSETNFGGVRAPYVDLEDLGIMTLVARTGLPHYAEDVDSDPYYYRLLSDTRSELAVPVFYNDRLLAVLDLESPVRNAFSVNDCELLETLAHQIATTIHNLSQYAELLRTQQAINARTMLINMSVVTNRWGHRIGNQAQIIVEQAELLERDLDRPQSERKYSPSERLRIITDLAEEIKRKPVKELLDREKGVRREPANALLRDVVDKLRAGWLSDHAGELIEFLHSYEAAETDCIAVNRTWFEMVVEIILENAVQYIRHEAAPRLDITTRRAGKMLEISFADNGPGIPAERRRQLTEEPVIKEPNESGHGIGLFLARLVMETYEGKIRADKNVPRGTVISLSFPCYFHTDEEPA